MYINRKRIIVVENKLPSVFMEFLITSASYIKGFQLSLDIKDY